MMAAIKDGERCGMLLLFMSGRIAYHQANSLLVSPFIAIKKAHLLTPTGKKKWYVMSGSRKSLFIFLMGLAWKCRYSMPLLLSGTVAVLGRAFMFQIRVHTVHTLHENELAYFEEEEDEHGDADSWETGSTDSWETIVEEVAYG